MRQLIIKPWRRSLGPWGRKKFTGADGEGGGGGQQRGGKQLTQS